MSPAKFILNTKAVVALASLLVLAVVPSFAGNLQPRNLGRLPDISCGNQDSGCFEYTRDILKNVTDPANHWAIFQNKKTIASQRAERSSTAVIIFPGLYTGPSQFRELADKLDREGYFVMQVSLPGHWGQEERSGEVQAQDWLDEAGRAIRIAHVMAEKVVLVGHSMGGMVSILAALNLDSKIDGLIAMEPAIQVRPEVTWSICNANYFVKTLGDVPALRNLLPETSFSDSEKHFSLKMGCEVANLRLQLIDRQFSKAERLEYRLEEGLARASSVPLVREVIEMRRSYKLGNNLRIPSLFFLNSSDKIVSTSNAGAFVKAIPSSVFKKVVFYGGIPHGMLTYEKSALVEANVLDFLEQIKKLPQ